jgi:hypothetical protein
LVAIFLFSLSIFHGHQCNDQLLQLVECIESIKSDVKKKMMEDESAIDTPKSPQRVANEFYERECSINVAVLENNLREFAIEHRSSKIPVSYHGSYRALAALHQAKLISAENVSTASIIQDKKTFAGAHEWLLSTRL